MESTTKKTFSEKLNTSLVSGHIKRRAESNTGIPLHLKLQEFREDSHQNDSEVKNSEMPETSAGKERKYCSECYSQKKSFTKYFCKC